MITRVMPVRRRGLPVHACGMCGGHFRQRATHHLLCIRCFHWTRIVGATAAAAHREMISYYEGAG